MISLNFCFDFEEERIGIFTFPLAPEMKFEVVYNRYYMAGWLVWLVGKLFGLDVTKVMVQTSSTCIGLQ